MSFTRIGLGVAGPLLLQRVIDDALPERDASLLALLCGLMIAAGLLASVLTVAQTALTNWVGQRVTAGLRVDLFDHARAQPLDFYGENGASQIQSRLVNDVEGADRFLTGTAQDALAQLTSLAAAAAAMLILSWPLALASFVLALLLSVLNNRFARLRRGLAKERQRQLTDVLHFVAENLSPPGIILGRTLCRTRTQRDRFIEICHRVRDVTYRQRVVGASAYTIIGASLACIPPVIYWMAGTVITGVSVGTVVVLVLLQMRLSDPIERLLQISGSVQASLATFDRIMEYLNLSLVERDSTAAPASDPVALRVRGLGHAYLGTDRPILADVDLDFPAGSVTVVAGPTGSGKSSLGLILAGLLQPSAGTVQADDAGPVSPDRLREIVTMVPQHTTLFKGSIRDNVRFARDDVTPDEIERAAAAARLDDLIALRPQGDHTPVGEDGFQLSGGERQRVGLVRALLAPSGVLILDEATSALDAITAERVHQGLRTYCRDRTLVIIAHRIPSLRPGDRVIVMDAGRVVETGSADELDRCDGAFSALLAAQHQPVQHQPAFDKGPGSGSGAAGAAVEGTR